MQQSVGTEPYNRFGPTAPKGFLASSDPQVTNEPSLTLSKPPQALQSMEYIIVEIKDQPNVHAEVLINRQPNGRTGVLLTLGGPGWILVSVDWPGAQERNVNVKNTTPSHPINVTIECT